ncbi:hypothetical protein [Pantoea allii]|uniref:hypothetical protein n=1 Tax=Pantoea allii TaxID=574096 RepID=UPI00214BAF9F|nr:hypothetical protein [Pantoea allii]
MLSNKSNKELVEAGHQFAKALDADMPLTEIAKLVSALSTRLDCAIVRGDELQQKLDAMAAENAALKCKNLIGYVKDADVADVANGRVGSLMPNDVFGEKPVYLSVDTPATDAYLNSVRAEGVDMVAEAIGNSAAKLKVGSKDWKELKSIVFTLVNFAAQLRSGTHDTAGKAGAK